MTTEEWNFDKDVKDIKDFDPTMPKLVSDSSSEESSSENGEDSIEEEVVNFLKNLPPTDDKRRSRIKKHLRSVKRTVNNTGLEIDTVNNRVFVDDTLIPTSQESGVTGNERDPQYQGLLM